MSRNFSTEEKWFWMWFPVSGGILIIIRCLGKRGFNPTKTVPEIFHNKPFHHLKLYQSLCGREYLSFLFWTLERECARTLGEGMPLWGWGAPGPQWETMSISWVWTGEERRRSKMSENKEDDPITASRNDHAQSKCHCALISNSVTYPLQELCLIVLLFQENKSFGASTICIHPLMYVKPCREHFYLGGGLSWCSAGYYYLSGGVGTYLSVPDASQIFHDMNEDQCMTLDIWVIYFPEWNITDVHIRLFMEREK